MYDETKQKFRFIASNVREGGTLLLGFSSNAATTDSDIVVFNASGSGSVIDKWGTFDSSSTLEDTDSYSDTTIDGSLLYRFTTYRAAEAVTASKDTTITCGTTSTYSWKVTGSPSGSGTWKLKTNADCSVVGDAYTPLGAAGLTLASGVSMGVVMASLF